jgi:hypothetical protein
VMTVRTRAPALTRHKPKARKLRTPDSNGKIKSREAGNLKSRKKRLGSNGGTPAPIFTPGGPYFATRDGLFVVRKTKDDTVSVPLTNFEAAIVAEIEEDDGAEKTLDFDIEVLQGKLRTRLRIPAADFSSMNWVLLKLGSSFVLHAGSMTKDHTRAAIQLLSGPVQRKTVFTHTGWRKHNGGWAYIHGGGAIGADGPVAGIEVKLPSALAPFVLQAPKGDREITGAIRASLDLLNLGPADLMTPLQGALYRSVLGQADFAVHVAGPTGSFKSEVAALMEQHLGAGFDRRHLPASWSSTGNALEGLAFTAKDFPLVIDDFAPTGSPFDRQRYHREAERIFRAQGNNSARQRMRADTSLRPPKPPRGLILSTGEEIPTGQSIRARCFILEFGPNTIDKDKLTEAQKRGAAGIYCRAFTAYLQWLAGHLDGIQQSAHERLAEFRKKATTSEQHRRTPWLVAELFFGWEIFLQFAQEKNVLSIAEKRELSDLVWVALGVAAAGQSKFQKTSEPTRRFLELTEAAIASGKAHLANLHGREPPMPEAFGWRSFVVGVDENERIDWRPQGDRIGWVDRDSGDLFLEPHASYSAAQRMAGLGGEGISVSDQTLHKRLDEKRLLKSKAKGRGLTVRKQVEGRRREVLHLDLGLLGELGQLPPPESPRRTVTRAYSS